MANTSASSAASNVTATGTGTHPGVEKFAFECYQPLYWVNGSSMRGSYQCRWWSYQILKLMSRSFGLCFVICDEIFNHSYHWHAWQNELFFAHAKFDCVLCKMNEIRKNEFSFVLKVSFGIFLFHRCCHFLTVFQEEV